MTYKNMGDKVLRINNLEKAIEIQDQVNSFKANQQKKKVEWLFVFRTSIDLQLFLAIIENVTNPEVPLSRDQPVVTLPRSESLERRLKEHLKRLGEDKEDDVKKVALDSTEAQMTAEELAREGSISKTQKIKDKVFREKK